MCRKIKITIFVPQQCCSHPNLFKLYSNKFLDCIPSFMHIFRTVVYAHTLVIHYTHIKTHRQVSLFTLTLNNTDWTVYICTMPNLCIIRFVFVYFIWIRWSYMCIYIYVPSDRRAVLVTILSALRYLILNVIRKWYEIFVIYYKCGFT